MDVFFPRLPVVIVGTAATITFVSMTAAEDGSTQQLNEVAKQITVLVRGQSDSGSGVLIARQGNIYFVLTAEHVIRGTNPSEEAYITTVDGQNHRLDSSKIQKFPGIDLAILQFASDRSYKTATLGDSNLVAELTPVVVAGYPLSSTNNLQLQITRGEVSGKGDFGEGYEMTYTAVTWRGMSGGPVLNENGYLIGIHGRADGNETENGIPVKSGFNFAITIQTFLEQYKLLNLGVRN